MLKICDNVPTSDKESDLQFRAFFLFSRNTASAKFRENKTLVKRSEFTVFTRIYISLIGSSIMDNNNILRILCIFRFRLSWQTNVPDIANNGTTRDIYTSSHHDQSTPIKGCPTSVRPDSHSLQSWTTA